MTRAYLQKTANPLLSALIIFTPLTHSLGSIFLGGLIGVFILWTIRERVGFRPQPAGTALFMLAFWSLITALMNGVSLTFIKKFYYFTPLLLAPLFSLVRPDYKKLFAVAGCTTSLMIILAFLQKEFAFTLPGPFQAYRGERFFSFAGHPIPIAGIYSFLDIILLSYVFFAKNTIRSKSFFLACAGVLTFGVLITESRSFYLAYGSTMLLMVIKGRNRRVLIGYTSALVLTAVFISSFPGLLQRVGTLFDLTFQSNSERLALWKVGFSVFTENPRNLFLGIGYGGWHESSLVYFERFLPAMKQAAVHSHVHNLYLQIMVETGLVGLGIYLGMIALIIRKLRNKLCILSPGGNSHAFVISALMCLFCYLIGGLFDYLNDPFILIYIYTILGLGLSVQKPESSAIICPASLAKGEEDVRKL